MALLLGYGQKIAIIRLVYVGLPLAVEFGKTRPAIGFDISELRIRDFKEGRDSILEVSAENLLEASRLSFTHDESDLKDCEILIVTVPTPINDVNRPDLVPILEASAIVARPLKVGDTVVYKSTVFPGRTEEICVPVLEKESGLTFNQEFFCGYSPERINPSVKVNTYQDQENYQWLYTVSARRGRCPLQEHYYSRYFLRHKHQSSQSGQGDRKYPARPLHRPDQ